MPKKYKKLSIKEGDKIKLIKKYFSYEFLKAYNEENKDKSNSNYDYNKEQFEENETHIKLVNTFYEKKQEYEEYKEKTLSNLIETQNLISSYKNGMISDETDYLTKLEQYENNIKTFTDKYKKLSNELEDMRQNSLDKSLRDIILYFRNQYSVSEFYGYIYEGENKYSSHLVNLRPFDSYEDGEDKPRDFYYVLPKTALTTYNFELIKEESPESTPAPTSEPESEPEPEPETEPTIAPEIPTGGKRTNHRRKSRTRNHRRKSRTRRHSRKSRKYYTISH